MYELFQNETLNIYSYPVVTAENAEALLAGLLLGLLFHLEDGCSIFL
jgi:hypothetical protein